MKPDYPNLTGCRQELAVLGRHILANIALGAFFARLVNDLSRSRSGLAAGMLAHEYNYYSTSRCDRASLVRPDLAFAQKIVWAVRTCAISRVITIRVSSHTFERYVTVLLLCRYDLCRIPATLH